MFNEKAFSKGSECPASSGVLRLYGMRFCPYVKRVLLVLNYLQIPYEVVNINLRSKPEWFLSKVPQGQVPAIEVNGEIISDSVICARYLDTVYGSNKLLGNALDDAKQFMLLSYVDKANSLFYNLLKHPEDYKEAQKKAEEPLAKLETVCHGGFFGGSQASMFDLLAYPVFERMSISREFLGKEFLQADKYVGLSKWLEFMKRQKYVNESFEDAKYLCAFLKQYFDTNCAMPDFDMGL